ncbi:MAG TPA: DinB family protein [Terriglobales bacterium]|nr:DinB family protein [Terriglobales bacterium]
MSDDVGRVYLDEVQRQFRGNKRQADGALAQLTDEEFFRAPEDPESNSIAILVKHMAGNMRSRFTDFLTSDGEKPWRHRDTEFELAAGATRAQLMQAWESGWKTVFEAVGALAPADLVRTAMVRGESYTALQAINRQLAHYAHHIGQIVFWAKHMKGTAWKTLSIPRGMSESAEALAAEKKWAKSDHKEPAK